MGRRKSSVSFSVAGPAFVSRYCAGGVESRAAREARSGRHENVRVVYLGFALNAQRLQDRNQLHPESLKRLGGFPDVDHAEAILPLSRGVGEQSRNRPIRRRRDPRLASSQSPDRLLVVLASEFRALKYRNNGHLTPPVTLTCEQPDGQWMAKYSSNRRVPSAVRSSTFQSPARSGLIVLVLNVRYPLTG